MLLSLHDYLVRLAEPRSIADIALVFLVVYAVLKILRGTRAAPMMAAIAALALLYWLALSQGLGTLEFVLRGGLLYIGVAIIVLFQAIEATPPAKREREKQLAESATDRKTEEVVSI